MTSRFSKGGVIFSLLIAVTGLVWGVTSIQLVPSVIDFGWAPDNAVIHATVRVRNNGGEMVPLTAVQPSCGCTATDFTPEGLPASEEMGINLNFNTRGYTGMKFDKGVKVKAGMPEEEFSVRLTGHVTNPAALVFPEGDGIVSFSPGNLKNPLVVMNKTDKAFRLSVLQNPEPWVEYRLPKGGLPASGTAKIELNIKGPLDMDRQTSTTIEASDGTESHRFTVVIRTGQSPEPYRKMRAAPKLAPAPAATPSGK